MEWFPDCLTSAAFRHPFVGELRSSGQYGPRVAVPDGSDAPTRMLAFIGRDPLRTGA